jgi:hypothetical protein
MSGFFLLPPRRGHVKLNSLIDRKAEAASSLQVAMIAVALTGRRSIAVDRAT